jgi:hypothetical protein
MKRERPIPESLPEGRAAAINELTIRSSVITSSMGVRTTMVAGAVSGGNVLTAPLRAIV